MGEIRSDQTIVQQYINEIKNKKNALSHTSSVATMSGFTNITPNDYMKKAFSNTLLYTDMISSYLVSDLERILSIAKSFEKHDHMQAMAIAYKVNKNG
ncbi:TIGR04197 family type VII secretion effector [Bacillus aquiflavi]|uniref:TIGR04197 family type VII secretion effector n=1 Tax=Bacillus aquiflavi TaxID=2672567 RepID=A0A6B3VX61_9BACI|nr:TIGR04197 family type VII secretion effector [Bacillus aquiflavi]MBA4536498.1 TIGR04197 family type VII secretion effector [Bacillus aquiflavi]NEY80865.1 TIGR04197 family type VII secretion effector [Bacillus aquiflavi]